MYFDLSEEHLMIQKAARDFAQNELKPGVIERDKTMIYPKEQVRRMAELGFFGMMVDPKWGGQGMDTLSYVLGMEEISKLENSCSVMWAALTVVVPAVRVASVYVVPPEPARVRTAFTAVRNSETWAALIIVEPAVSVASVKTTVVARSMLLSAESLPPLLARTL